MPILSSTSGLSARAYGLFNQPIATGSFDSIATTTVGAGGSSSITFSSLPTTYKHLQIRVYAKGNNAAIYDSFLVRFNGDTANNYTLHWLSGDGVTASSLGITPYGAIRGTEITGNTTITNAFGVSIVDILDYGSTNKYKTARVVGGDDRVGGGSLSLNSGVWMNTAAITSITITPVFGTSFLQYSSFALYGLKG